MILRSQIRAADYRARARAAAALAGASVLQRVRERHQVAAATWKALAKSEEKWVTGLRRRFGRAALAQPARASAQSDEQTTIMEPQCQ